MKEEKIRRENEKRKFKLNPKGRVVKSDVKVLISKKPQGSEVKT